jgi:hypothetical protein
MDKSEEISHHIIGIEPVRTRLITMLRTRGMLFRFCKAHGIPYNNTYKFAKRGIASVSHAKVVRLIQALQSEELKESSHE